MKKILLSFLVILVSVGLVAQDKQEEEDHSYKPLTLKLTPDGKKFIRFINWHQIWATTQNLSDDNADFSITPSIRRSRFLTYAQISSKFLILTHFGLNGLTPNNLTSLGNNGNAPQLFLHGAWGEVKLSDELYVGSGLHYWKGMTRLANQSTLNFMTLDQSRPFVHWHSLGNTDQFARHLGIYAKGTINKFHYRIAANQRMNPANALRGATSYNGDTTISINGSGNSVIEGYFEYQFWDKEGDKLPYKVGTYMGKKKIFNIGVGFYTQPNGARNNVTGQDETVGHFAGDVFLELPTSSGALNAYASYMQFNYGGDEFVGRWAGTGSNIYLHTGYYIKKANIMPYIAFQQGNYEGYPDPVTAVNAGVNYYLNGHFAKFTLEYHSIQNQLSDGAADVSQLRLQMHIFL